MPAQMFAINFQGASRDEAHYISRLRLLSAGGAVGRRQRGREGAAGSGPGTQDAEGAAGLSGAGTEEPERSGAVGAE